MILFLLTPGPNFKGPRADAILVRAKTADQAQTLAARRLGLWQSNGKSSQFSVGIAPIGYGLCHRSLLFLGEFHAILAQCDSDRLIFHDVEDFRRCGYSARVTANFATPAGQAAQLGQRWSTANREELRLELDKRRPLQTVQKVNRGSQSLLSIGASL